MTAYLWLAAAILLAVVEGLTLALVSVWFAGGAVAAFLGALLGAAFPVQLLLFVAVSAILLACLRPLARKKAVSRPVRTNADRILGRSGVVTETIDNLRGSGAVRIDGVEWTARSEDGASVEAGVQVKILRIEGVKVFVEPAGVPANL